MRVWHSRNTAKIEVGVVLAHGKGWRKALAQSVTPANVNLPGCPIFGPRSFVPLAISQNFTPATTPANFGAFSRISLHFKGISRFSPQNKNGSQTIVCEPLKVVAGVGFEPTTFRL